MDKRLSKSYDWIVQVLITQNRIISFEDLWISYPFKTNGLTKHGLDLLYNTIKEKLIGG
jgi:hypothetical protein